MKKVIIKSKTGIHARPASLIVKKCSDFESQIYLIRGEVKADARSIMNIMAMAIMYDEEIIIQAEGPDAKLAEEAIFLLLESEG